MTIRARGDKFQADFMAAGRRYRQEFTTHEAAEAWEMQSRVSLMKGKEVEMATQARPGAVSKTISGLAEYAAETHWVDAKAIAMARNARLFVTFVGPKVLIPDALTTQNVNAYAKQLTERNRSPATLNRHLSAISVLCKIAVEQNWLEQRPKGVKWHRKEGRGRIRFYDEREELALLTLLRDWGLTELAEFYEFLIDTGARLNEALKLQWRDVSADNRSVLFHMTKNGLDRSVPLFARSKAILERRRADPVHALAKGPWHDIEPRDTMRLWPKMVEALPFLEDCVTHHTCRHTRASRFAIAGHDIVRIKEFMGHKNLNTTLRYAHLRPKHLEEMVA